MIRAPEGGKRIVGTTEECFTHFINQFRGLEAATLLAEFCFPGENKDRDELFADLGKVLGWQMGRYFPAGDALLRLRCFLHLTGRYDVVEFKKLNGDAQLLALTIAVISVDPRELEGKVGYSTGARSQKEWSAQPRGLWRILVQGQGYTSAVEEKIQNLNKANRSKVTRASRHWQERIERLFNAEVPTERPTPPRSSTVTPEVAAAFARQIGATIALGKAIGGDAEAVGLVRELTRGGSDLRELVEILSAFF